MFDLLLTILLKCLKIIYQQYLKNEMGYKDYFFEPKIHVDIYWSNKLIRIFCMVVSGILKIFPYYQGNSQISFIQVNTKS